MRTISPRRRPGDPVRAAGYQLRGGSHRLSCAPRHAAGAGRALRKASSAGEPLTPEVNEWARDKLGITVHDHYGQTELGMVFCNHHHPAMERPVRPGSMGMPLPGWSTGVLTRGLR